MEQKKSGTSNLFPVKRVGVAEQEPAKKETVGSKSSKSLNYLVLVAGVLVILLLAFFFFKFVADKDKLYSFEANLKSAVDTMYSSNVGAVREVIIPLPSSVDNVCFANYKSDSEFGVDVTLQPGSEPFKMQGLFSVENDSFCVPADGSFEARMQLFSKAGSNFVGVYFNSVDTNLYPSVSTTSQTPSGQPQQPPPQTPTVNESKPPTQLSDMQQTACQSASTHNTCDRLISLGVVTKEQCCSELVLCC